MKISLVYAALLMLLAVPPVAAQEIPFSPQELAAERKYVLLDRAGVDAAKARDYADAATDLRRATQVPWLILPSTFAELGVALDHLGKKDEAFTSYRKAFGFPVLATLEVQGGPDVMEALARYGTLCEERGLRGDAVQCFNKALLGREGVLYSSLDGKSASPALVRAMLDDVRGAALQDEATFGKNRTAEAMTAFQDAVRLVPKDPRPYLFLAEGFRHTGRYAEAEAAVRRVSRLDKTGDLKFWAEQSLELVHKR